MARLPLLILVLLLSSFTAGAAEQRPGANVFAAASLKESLDEQVRLFAARAGTRVVVSYLGSAALARQIERGAPAELFISADLDWMNYLERRKLLQSGSRINLLSNRLVLVAPMKSGVTLKIEPGFALARALGGGRLAMADPRYVPAGKYGRAALTALGAWQTVEKSILRAENVRAALAFVARGEAPLGVVYLTDALAEPSVRIVGEFPAGSHHQIIYPAALIAGRDSQRAKPLLDYLKSTDAQAIWRKHGFGIPD